MKPRHVASCLLATLWWLAAMPAPLRAQPAPPTGSQPSPAKPAATAPLEIVFVGNSLTHFHDLPAMVQALGHAATPPRQIRTTMLAPGGFTLEQHWAATGAAAPRTVLKQQKPDFVVLQEQSRRPIDDPKRMLEFAGKFATLAKQRRAEPVWYQTWARSNEPQHQDGIAVAYEQAQQKFGGRLAPVGRAFQLALQQTKEPSLHSPDGIHPTPAGSYLAALVLYATMTGADVTTSPDRLVVAGADGKERVLVELAPEAGAHLRRLAAKCVADQRPPARR